KCWDGNHGHPVHKGILPFFEKKVEFCTSRESSPHLHMLQMQFFLWNVKFARKNALTAPLIRGKSGEKWLKMDLR
ncbi:MAG: hypothetical protein J5855_03365, partial [Mailhella sp.]|nr:hypothetical protein [Mailhella sp.]